MPPASKLLFKSAAIKESIKKLLPATGVADSRA